MGRRRRSKQVEGRRRSGGTDRRGEGASPPCAICGTAAPGPRMARFLTHGVCVWLCAAHGSEVFMCVQGGQEFAQRLGAQWTACGVLGTRRRAALSAHLMRLRSAIEGQGKPGSHSWPRLRGEAERRFAAGEPPATVIAELCHAHRDGPARPPSVRTMRRWFTQARWLAVVARTGSGSVASAMTSRPVPTSLRDRGRDAPRPESPKHE